MNSLSESRIAELLAPYLPSTSHSGMQTSALLSQLVQYLDLLLRWNARTNLTAVRDPEEIVRRHFGESLFTAVQLASHLPEGSQLLDFGSGAGFPGLPIQLYLPGVHCTLAESQGKKAAFLREVVRTLSVHAEVWTGRVEAMPPARRFTCVTMRAVDAMDVALPAAIKRVGERGLLVILGAQDSASSPEAFEPMGSFHIPESNKRMVYLYARRPGDK